MKTFVVILTYVLCAQAKFKYDGYKVFRLQPSQNQNDLLLNLQYNDNTLDFLTMPNKVGLPVDILVTPERTESFKQLMIDNEIDFEITIDDLQSVIDSRPVYPKNNDGKLDWTDFHELQTIYEWLDELAATRPEVQVSSMGLTEEKRSIQVIKISFGPDKRAVLIESGIHAREWIAPATATYLINELLNSEDPRFRRVAESFDWHIIPVFNPDGYEYTFTDDRMWRKNRAPYEPCMGADNNRNFDFHWGEIEGRMNTRSINNTCSDTYPGTRAFSELESQHMKRYVTEIGSKLDVSLALHSCGQYLLIPFGNTTDHLGNFDDALRIGQKAAEAIEARYGADYIVGNAAEAMYPTSGDSHDWIKSTFDVPLVYTIELRPRRDSYCSFLLPPEEIIPNCEEIVDGLIAMFEEGEKLGYFKLG